MTSRFNRNQLWHIEMIGGNYYIVPPSADAALVALTRCRPTATFAHGAADPGDLAGRTAGPGYMLTRRPMRS